MKLPLARKFLLPVGGLVVLGMGLAVYLTLQSGTSQTRPFSDQELAARSTALSEQFGETNRPQPAVYVPLKIAEHVRLAVGGLGLASESQDRQLGDLVTADLSHAPGLQLVERQSLDAVLRELHLSLYGFVRAKEAVRVGKLLQVDWFLLGTEAQINGTNSLVVRLVDARTGVMRDAGVIYGGRPPVELAADLAAFVRQSRQNAAQAKARVYLAVGAFEDRSVNNRRADFPKQLRSYLTAAYQGSDITLLEREYVDTLLQEMHLDQAGLTDTTDTNAPPMQSAFWLVSGQYQSYETTNLLVEVNLDVQRIWGDYKHFTLCDLPGNPIEEKIKEKLDGVIHQDTGAIVPSRRSEIGSQMSIGRHLMEEYRFASWPSTRKTESPSQRNMEEAIRAFETVLLLDPDNREAQVLLGNCFEVESIGRPAEARECYRKIIESPIQDKWSEQARQHLNFTFDYYHIPLEEKLKFFETTAAQTTVPAAIEFYREQAKSIRDEMALKQPGSKAQQLVEAGLFSSITNAMSNDIELDVGLNDFVQSFGTNRTAAARRLAELYPRLIAQATNLTPYLLAAVVTAQVDTNAPLVREFDSLLDEYIAHPEKLNSPKAYWQRIWGPVSHWSFEHGRYDLAVKVLTESLRLDASAGQDCDEQAMALGFAYVYLEQWQEALDIFESCSNRPPHFFYWPVWGGRQDFIITERWRDYCRKKLGLPAVKDPREFDLGKSILRLHAPAAFVVDQNSLWVGIGGQLLNLDFELHTNLVIGLPFDAATPVTTLCVTSSNIWIATRGAGLIDFNKSSQQFRRFTETNGLAMNSISTLHWSSKVLWMAYNGATGGGLGQLDPASGKIKSYMRELRTRGLQFDPGRPSEEKLPPGVGVRSIVSDPSGNPWMFVTGGILKYDTVQETWNPIPRALGKALYGFTADASWLAEAVGVKARNVADHTETGMDTLTNHLTVTNRIVTKAERDVLDLILRFDYLNYPRGTFSERVYNSDEIACYVSLAVQSWSDQEWRTIQDDTAIPNPPNTMTLAGDDLWMGGTGYIARVDLRQGKVRNYCHIAVDEVDRIQIGGGYAWIQLGWYLYRVPLSSLP